MLFPILNLVKKTFRIKPYLNIYTRVPFNDIRMRCHHFYKEERSESIKKKRTKDKKTKKERKKRNRL